MNFTETALIFTNSDGFKLKEIIFQVQRYKDFLNWQNISNKNA
jgi:hypothetical protein